MYCLFSLVGVASAIASCADETPRVMRTTTAVLVGGSGGKDLTMKTRTVLITGGARGIGRAIADLYASRHWTVVCPKRAELDLANLASVEAWVAQYHAGIDVLINNAGENPIGLIADLSRAAWERNLAVNLTSPMLLAQGVAKGMCEQRWGRIVNIGSIFSHVSRAGRGPYTAAKSGLVGFTRTAAIEWGADNVLVNAVCPGYVETDLTRQNNTPDQIAVLAKSLPLGRLGQPDEIARAVYFLGSDENSFITGQTLIADGGFTAQ